MVDTVEDAKRAALKRLAATQHAQGRHGLCEHPRFTTAKVLSHGR